MVNFYFYYNIYIYIYMYVCMYVCINIKNSGKPETVH